MLDTDRMKTQPILSALYVLLGLWYGLLGVLAIFSCFTVIAITYWMLMALRKIVSAIPNSWRRLLNSGYGWSKHQKTLLPRSAYVWMRRGII